MYICFSFVQLIHKHKITMEEKQIYPDIRIEDIAGHQLNYRDHQYNLHTVIRKKKNKTWYDIRVSKFYHDYTFIPDWMKIRLLNEFHQYVYQTLILFEVSPKLKTSRGELICQKSKLQCSEVERLTNIIQK